MIFRKIKTKVDKIQHENIFNKLDINYLKMLIDRLEKRIEGTEKSVFYLRLSFIVYMVILFLTVFIQKLWGVAE